MASRPSRPRLTLPFLTLLPWKAWLRPPLGHPSEWGSCPTSPRRSLQTTLGHRNFLIHTSYQHWLCLYLTVNLHYKIKFIIFKGVNPILLPHWAENSCKLENRFIKIMSNQIKTIGICVFTVRPASGEDMHLLTWATEMVALIVPVKIEEIAER